MWRQELFKENLSLSIKQMGEALTVGKEDTGACSMPQGNWCKKGTWHPPPTILQTAGDDKLDIAKLTLQRLEKGAWHIKRIRKPRLAVW